MMKTDSTTTLLREWKRLSDAESTAITLRDWDELNRLLDEKSRLQGLLDDYEAEDYNAEGRALVSELINRTTLNQARLKTEMTVVQGQIQDSDRAANNIRKVDQAYGAKPADNYWQTYS